MTASLRIGPFELSSRLFVGTGKYRSVEENLACVDASASQVVTVAVRRVDLSSSDGRKLSEGLLARGVHILPNTAGCATAAESVRTARLAREMLGTPLVKLEVIGDPKNLFPDVVETLEAAKVLVAEGFVVLAYTTDDPITAKKLEHLGCAAVMPLAAPIGSGLGIRNPTNLLIIREQARVPVVVDAGVGTASDAAVAMELGCDAVLLNTAIAESGEPVRMARAMRLAVEAGRDAFLAGRMPKRVYASASSPTSGRVGTT